MEFLIGLCLLPPTTTIVVVVRASPLYPIHILCSHLYTIPAAVIATLRLSGNLHDTQQHDYSRKTTSQKQLLTPPIHTYRVVVIMATQMRGLTQVSGLRTTYMTTYTYNDFSISLTCEHVVSGSSRKSVSTVRWLTSVRSSRMGTSMGIKRRSILPR